MTLTDYLADLARAGRSPNTVAAYRRDLAEFAPTADGLRTYVAALDGFKPSTRARKIDSARAYCRWLGAPEGWKTVLVPMPLSARPPAELDPDVIARLLAAPTGDGPIALRDRAVLALLADAGCRASELVGLDVRDVLPNRSVAVASGHLVRWREVLLSEWTALDVADYLVRGRPLLPIRDNTGALFVNHRGDRLSRQGLWLLVHAHCRAAGLPPISPSDLRHAAAYRLVAFATNIKDAQDLLGHANITTTQAYRLRATGRAA